MQRTGIERGRKAALFGFTTTAIVMALASTAFACVAFMGQMTVDGHDADTTVVGTGNSHDYCSTGKPTTAAAGHLNDTVTLVVGPAHCSDNSGPQGQQGGAHKLPAGTYEVRYRNVASYDFDGTSWIHRSGHGCFRPVNAGTSSVIGTFDVNALGVGLWRGTISPIIGPDLDGDGQGNDVVYSDAGPTAGTANNFCIGSQDPNLRPKDPLTGAEIPTTGGRPGLLAPYRMLSI